MSRLLPWMAAAAFAAAVFVWVGRDLRLRREAFRPDSVHNASEEGLSGAARYLRERGRRVRELTALVGRGDLEPRGVLFRLRPETGGPPSDAEPDAGAEEKPVREEALLAPAEDAWVRAGGRLVLGIEAPYASLRTEPAGDAAAVKVFPAWPGVDRLQPPSTRRLAGAVPGVAVFADEQGPWISRWTLGEGEVVLLAVPEIFRNGHLSRADHLALLERLADEDRPIRFDEHVHALRREEGILEVLRGWGFGPFLVFSAATALVAAWRRRARLGPPEDDARETRVEAVDLVDSVALLYERVLLRRQALALYAQALERETAMRTGLTGAALEAKVRQLLPARPSRPKGKDVTAAEFAREMKAINDAFRRLSDERRSRRDGKAAARPRPA